VFRAYQPEQDRLVAVKLLRIDIPPERTHQLVVQLEQLIAADLTHAGIAAPLATGISEASAYLAMDFVAADSLDIVIRDQQLPSPSDAVRVATQLASALDLAAAINITHGALHPRDVLLSADDVRLTGIGIVRALAAVGFAAPIRRPYTAPERASGAAWDRRADVFSLAALVFELLTRRRISGPGDQPFDSFAGVAGASADALDRVFDRALAEQPGDRFPTAGDFAKALQAAVERKRSAAGRVGASIRTPAADPVVAPPPSTLSTDEELPLFTDSMLGGRARATSPGQAAPPPIVDPSRDAMAEDLSFRDAPLSTVEPLHEPDLRSPEPDRRSNDQDRAVSVHPMRPGTNRHRQSTDDFKEAVHETPSPIEEPSMSVDKHSPDAPHDWSLKRHEPAFDLDGVVAPEAAAELSSHPAPFESITAEGRSSSGVWPLMLALVVGIALGFGMAMLLLGRDRVPPAPQQAASPSATGRAPTEVRDEPVREVTEQTVEAAPKPAAPAPTAAAKPDVSHSVASNPVPAPATSANVKPNEAKPAIAAPAKPPAERADSRVARTPTRPQGKASLSAAKTPAPSSKGAATATRPAASATKAAANAAPGRGARPAAATAAKGAAPTPPTATTGSLVVDSRPPGASVFIDGRRVGTTPFVLETLKPGQYTIGLDIDGYKRWATTVKVTTGERSRVAASLER
jgi:serine/threonine-protein kinase